MTVCVCELHKRPLSMSKSAATVCEGVSVSEHVAVVIELGP